MRLDWLVIIASVGCTHASGGGSDAATRCVSTELLPGGGVAERATHSFDANGRIVQTDWERPSDNEMTSWTYGYDDQGRPISIDSTQDTVTATYTGDQVVVAHDGSETYQYDLAAGQIVHSEGPLEVVASLRDISDIGYDANGRVSTRTDRSFDDEVGEAISRTMGLTYDDLSRLVKIDDTETAGTDQTNSTFTLTYQDTADGWTVHRVAPGGAVNATFAFDSSGRLVRSGIDEDGDGQDDWYATYTYDDATSTIDGTDVRPATSPEGRQWQMIGHCASPHLPTAVETANPMGIPATDVTVPSPGESVVSP